MTLEEETLAEANIAARNILIESRNTLAEGEPEEESEEAESEQKPPEEPRDALILRGCSAIARMFWGLLCSQLL